MIPNDIDFLARKERCNDMRREAQYAWLIRQAKLQQPRRQSASQRLRSWLGRQLVQWGLKLQHNNLTQLKNLKELAENTD